MKGEFWIFIKIWAVFTILNLFLRLTGFAFPSDDSDPRDGRSGMILRVDALTGCQYLASPVLLGESALSPRMGADGKQICNAKEK